MNGLAMTIRKKIRETDVWINLQANGTRLGVKEVFNMTADLWVKVDVDNDDKIVISKAIETLHKLLGEFEKIGYKGTEEREGALEVTIDTLQMILRGEVF